MANRSEITTLAKHVYARLCRYAGQNGHAFPSYNTLANEIGSNRRQVIREIGRLSDIGLIHITHCQNDLSGNRSNTYRFVWHPWMQESFDKPVALVQKNSTPPLVTACHQGVKNTSKPMDKDIAPPPSDSLSPALRLKESVTPPIVPPLEGGTSSRSASVPAGGVRKCKHVRKISPKIRKLSWAVARAAVQEHGRRLDAFNGIARLAGAAARLLAEGYDRKNIVNALHHGAIAATELGASNGAAYALATARDWLERREKSTGQVVSVDERVSSQRKICQEEWDRITALSQAAFSEAGTHFQEPDLGCTAERTGGIHTSVLHIPKSTRAPFFNPLPDLLSQILATPLSRPSSVQNEQNPQH